MNKQDTAINALQSISPNLPMRDWVALSYACKEEGVTFDQFNQWSKGGDTYDPKDCKALWDKPDKGGAKSDNGGAKSNKGGATSAKLFYLAEQAGWVNPNKFTRKKRYGVQDMLNDWDNASTDIGFIKQHPYIANEKRDFDITDNILGVRRLQDDYIDNLLIPMYDDVNQDKPANLIYIYQKDGKCTKRNYAGISIKDSHQFNAISGRDNPTIIIFVEGAWTGLAIHKSTDELVVICGSTSNYDRVVSYFRIIYPITPFIIGADNKPNERLAAVRVATRHNALVAVPSDNLNSGDDFYDLLVKEEGEGKQAVIARINSAVEPDRVDTGVVINTTNKNNISSGEVIDNLNKKHAVVMVNGQFRILTRHHNIPPFNYSGHTLSSYNDVRQFYKNKTIEIETEKGTKQKNKLDVWIESELRREYSGIVFHPDFDTAPSGYYNLWRGFNIKPVEGNVDPYLEHILVCIADNDQSISDYIIKWLAHLVQKPYELPETALILSGSQGTGKNSMVDPFEIILGQHYATFTRSEQLTGRFNSHLENLIMCFANESMFGGDRGGVGALKSMITDSLQSVEPKGTNTYQVRNFKRVIIASNEDWPAHIDMDDRRFLVCKVSDIHKEDRTYFTKFYNWLGANGPAHLLHHLLNVDITSFNPRDIPANNNAFDIKMMSADSFTRWLYEFLNDGEVYLIDKLTSKEMYLSPSWGVGKTCLIIRKEYLYQHYSDFCQQQRDRYPYTSDSFGRKLKSIIPFTSEREGSGIRKWCYRIPPLDLCRQQFTKKMKLIDYKWGNT